MHVPAKFRENTALRFWVTVRKLNVTDRRTDGRGALQYLPSRAFGAAGDKNNCQFFIYGPQYTKICIFGYSGGPGWPINDRAHLASQLSSHLYQFTYKIWKQSDKDFLSYRENDEMSADAAERRLNHSIPRTYIRTGDKIRLLNTIV